MRDWIFKIGLLLLFIVVIVLYIYLADFSPPKSKEDEILNRIEQLEKQISKLQNQKDSIRVVIDSTHVKIITNEKHYQERINTIMVQSISADSCFITDYIRFHRSQRDSNNIR